jgi:hypothetical protein
VTTDKDMLSDQRRLSLDFRHFASVTGLTSEQYKLLFETDFMAEKLNEHDRKLLPASLSALTRDSEAHFEDIGRVHVMNLPADSTVVEKVPLLDWDSRWRYWLAHPACSRQLFEGRMACESMAILKAGTIEDVRHQLRLRVEQCMRLFDVMMSSKEDRDAMDQDILLQELTTADNGLIRFLSMLVNLDRFWPAVERAFEDGAEVVLGNSQYFIDGYPMWVRRHETQHLIEHTLLEFDTADRSSPHSPCMLPVTAVTHTSLQQLGGHAFASELLRQQASRAMHGEYVWCNVKQKPVLVVDLLNVSLFLFSLSVIMHRLMLCLSRLAWYHFQAFSALHNICALINRDSVH